MPDNNERAGNRDVAGIKQFCQRLTDSGLMDGPSVRTFWDSLDDTVHPANAEDLAAELVKSKKLTPYQTHRLKEGDVKGLVIDQYTVVDKIGQGGMGQVLKAHHRRMQRYVALKIISEKLLDSPQALVRFEQETRAAAQLSHPNIVAAYDAAEKDGMHYLVLEYVDGQDLSQIVHRKGPLRVALAIDYIIQTAEGLAYAHRKGIVHRDVKPANLLVDSSGVIKILDMGLAFMSSPAGAIDETTDHRLTQQGQVMGTTAYMAPEQAVDVRNADARSDIYSLGCTLYELLIGSPPYKGDTMMAVIVAHREDPIPSLCSQRVEVPAWVQQVFAKMVAKKPDERYASMSEVIAALREGSLEGASKPPVTSASPPPAAPPPSRSATGTASPALESSGGIAIATEEAPAFNPDTLNVVAAKHDTVVSRHLTKKKSRSAEGVIALVTVLGIGLLGALGAGAAAIMLSLRTPQGTLIVESDDPDVQVSVKQGGKVVEIIDAGDDWKIRLSEGEYDLAVTGGNDKFQLDKNTLVVTGDEVEKLRVTLKPLDLAANAPELPKPAEDPVVGGLPKPPIVPPKPPGGAPLPGFPPRPPAPPTEPVAEAIPKLELIREFKGRRSAANSMVFSPDGKKIAACGRDNHVVMWDVTTGRVVKTIQTDSSAWDLAFSPDGKKLATVGDNFGAFLYDAESGELIHKLSWLSDEEVQKIVDEEKKYPLMSALAFSPDGKKLVTGNNNKEVFVWDTATGKELAQLEAHVSSIYDIAYAPDGQHFATCSYDGTSQLWDAKTNEPTHMLRHGSESTVFDVQFSHNSEVLFSAGNTTDVVAWDVATGKEVIAMRGHGAPVICMSLNSDGTMIVSTGASDNSMRFWDVATGSPLSVLRNSPQQPSYVRFSPVDPTLFATGGADASVRLWRYKGQEVDKSGSVRTLDDGTVIVHQEVRDDHLVSDPWQSFKPPVNGVITRIDLQPALAEGKQGDLSFYEGEGINGTRIHTQRYTVPATGNDPWKSFELDKPLEVFKGVTYTFELDGAIGMWHAKADRYGDGRASGGADFVFRLYFTPKKDD